MSKKRSRRSSRKKGKRSPKKDHNEVAIEEEITPIPSIKTNSDDIFKSTAEQRKTFWETFARAVETEPIHVKSLDGLSGLSHPTIAAGIDRSRKRLIIISGDPDGRSAALAQADIQSAYTDYKVISARPIAVNLSKTAEALANALGKMEIRGKDLDRFSKAPERTKKIIERKSKLFVEKGLIPAIQALGYAAINTPATWQDVFKQLSHVQIITSSDNSKRVNNSEQTNLDLPHINFGLLVALDPSELDRQMGICSVPLYELSSDEVEIFHSGKDIEAAREFLKSHQIFQYFFPSADHLALGLLEKESLSNESLLERINKSPEIGHPFGQLELISDDIQIDQIVEALKEKGFAVEGEFGLELTENSQILRSSVKFKPREGFLSKLSKIFSIKIDLKDFIDLLKP